MDEVRAIIHQAQENEETAAVRLYRSQLGQASLMQLEFLVWTGQVIRVKADWANWQQDEPAILTEGGSLPGMAQAM